MAISRVLIANRGEIALRIIRACQELGIETVLAASAADLESLPARVADRTVCVGPAPAAESYLSVPTIVTAAVSTGADAVHPGYGFLAESPTLAEACSSAGITFVGPRADQMRAMGDKLRSRVLAREAGVPVLQGSEKIDSAAQAASVAEQVGLPVMLKASAGGGGRGMKVVHELGALPEVFASASAEARSAFGDPTMYVERYIVRARHIEVQVVGDGSGGVVHLGDRDCSLQRRHQKLIEEAPAVGIPDDVREQIRESALMLARAIDYRGAGTVEFIYDEDDQTFHFLEMNTRIQVEHPVSELVTGIDLVQEQFRVADGQPLSFTQGDVIFRGHAIECRITAEIPSEDFRPDAGRITEWSPPVGTNIRVDTHCHTGYTVPVYYDSLLAKLIVYAPTRPQAVARMSSALRRFVVDGVGTTLPFLERVIDSDAFATAQVRTDLLAQMQREFTVTAG